MTTPIEEDPELAILTVRQRQVIQCLRAGLTLAETAAQCGEYGVTVERVRQLRAAAGRRIKHYWYERKLREAAESEVEALLSEKRQMQEARATAPPSPLDLRLEQLGLGPHAFNALRRADIWTVGQVYALCVEGLCDIRNFGKVALTDVQERLRALGLPPVGSEREPPRWRTDEEWTDDAPDEG